MPLDQVDAFGCVSDPVDCGDNDICTADSCDKSLGCVSEPIDGCCDADDDCTGFGTCSVQLDEVTLGVISIDGLDAPLALVKCTFNGTTLDPPVPGDFDITIEDSTDPQGNLISVALSVTVSPL